MTVPGLNETVEWRLLSRREMSPESLVYAFCRLLEEELVFRGENGLDPGPLKAYYRNLFKEGDKTVPAAAFGYSRRFAGLIKELEVKQEKGQTAITIMDAGCGYGSESLLFALLGHDAVGVELVRERAELARSRIPFFQSRCAFPLKIRFENANILEFLERSSPLDAIWSMEAVSHIYPPEAFLNLAYQRLKTDGLLIVSDPNKKNPWAFVRSVRIRGGLRHAPHQRFRDPEKGAPVDYGQENIFTAPGFKRELEKAGFRVKSLCYSGFMGTSFFPENALRKKLFSRFLISVEKSARKIPFVKSLGSIYTAIAVKE